MLKKIEPYEINDSIAQMKSVSNNLNIKGIIVTEAQKLDSVEKPYLATSSIHKDEEFDNYKLFEIVNKWNKNSGWNYKNSFFIKPKDELKINDKDYSVSGFIYDSILYTKLILCDSEKNLYEIDLKKMDNCEFLIEQIKETSKPFYPNTKETLKAWTLRNLNIKNINEIPEDVYAENYFNLVKLFKNGKDIKTYEELSIKDNIKNAILELEPEKNIKEIKTKKKISIGN